MGDNAKYYLKRDNTSKEIVYIEYENMNGYNIVPKNIIKSSDAINVTKVVFVSPSLTEKIIKKKIDKKIEYLLNQLRIIESSDDDNDDKVRQSLMDAERLKLMILDNYVRYLGPEYRGLTLKKIQLIINEYRIKLYMLKDKEEMLINEQTKGRSR